jgi:hypothetical protein
VGTWFRPIGVGVPMHRMTSDGRVAYVVHRRCLGGWCRETVSSGFERARGLSRSNLSMQPTGSDCRGPIRSRCFLIEQESPL